MTLFKFYLDTDALNRLSALEGKKLEEFKERFDSLDAELIFTHVQLDERYAPADDRNYQEIVDKARKMIESKGIHVKFENAKTFILGISRIGLSSLSCPEIDTVYHELDGEINACEKAKGNTKEQLNVKRDAIIAVSSLERSFLITTDRCLCDSFNKVIKEKKDAVERFITPTAECSAQSSEAVADCILASLSKK